MNLVERKHRQTLKLIVRDESNMRWEQDVDFNGKGILIIQVGTEARPATDQQMYEVHQSLRQEMRDAAEENRAPIFICSQNVNVRYIKME